MPANQKAEPKAGSLSICATDMNNRKEERYSLHLEIIEKMWDFCMGCDKIVIKISIYIEKGTNI